MVVSEIDPEMVSLVRAGKGTYFCNVAHKNGLETREITDLEIYNPLVPEDRENLLLAIAEASELCTALPSYNLYDAEPASVAALLAEGLAQKVADESLPSAVVYAAENDAHAAARLKGACQNHYPSGFGDRVFFSDTVIAKMCSVVSQKSRILTENLIPVVKSASKAFLVEAFDQILIDDGQPTDFVRGLKKFITKTDLSPFALTKFYGHNAIHATLGFLAKQKGLKFMHEISQDQGLMNAAGEAFVSEAGVGLRYEFSGVNDVLFTEQGFRNHAEDALGRMINPFLRDPVDRVVRDPVRKLGWNDRLLGSMKLARKAGVCPSTMIRAVQAALPYACRERRWKSEKRALQEMWSGVLSSEEKSFFMKLILP